MARVVTGLPVRVVPCLDVRNGRVVKGVAFQGLRDQGDPAALAAAYEEQGADEVVVLDVSATPDGRRTRLDTVRTVRAALLGAPHRRGRRGPRGGRESSPRGPGPTRWPRTRRRFGGRGCSPSWRPASARSASWSPSTRPRLGRRGPTAGTRSWCGPAPSERASTRWRGLLGLLRQASARCSSPASTATGTKQGYDLELLRRVRAAVSVPIVASGGAESPEHMAEAVRAGADAVLAGVDLPPGPVDRGGPEGSLAGAGACGSGPTEPRTLGARRDRPLDRPDGRAGRAAGAGPQEGAGRRRPAPARRALWPGGRSGGRGPGRGAGARVQRRRDRGAVSAGAVQGRRRHPQPGGRGPVAGSGRREGGAGHGRRTGSAGGVAAEPRGGRAGRLGGRGGRERVDREHRPHDPAGHGGASRAGGRVPGHLR